MQRFIHARIACVAAVLCAMVVPDALGRSPAVQGGAPVEAARPRQPGGLLGDTLGIYLTIEGVLYDGKGKVESNTLMVDTVDGKKLDTPIGILIHNVRRLPAKSRCVLKGYELGAMIGTPPAVPAATVEQGKEYVERSAAAWRWRPYFVVLISAEPADLELIEK